MVLLSMEPFSLDECSSQSSERLHGQNTSMASTIYPVRAGRRQCPEQHSSYGVAGSPFTQRRLQGPTHSEHTHSPLPGLDYCKGSALS